MTSRLWSARPGARARRGVRVRLALQENRQVLASVALTAEGITSMRGKKLRRLLGLLLAGGLAVVVTGQVAFAGRVHTKAPPDVPGFDGSTIKLGVITPESGLASVVGKPLTDGTRVYWDAKNAKGGVAGKYKVDLEIEDSQYQVETALQAYDKIKGDVVGFQQILGTQITKSILPRLKHEQLTAAPATLDSTWVREKNLVPIGAPYQVEAANGIDYYLKNGGKGKKICALAQDDEYGAAGLDGLSEASKQLRFKVAKTVRFATTSDVSAQVGELADANCDAVLLVSLPNDTASIVTKMIGRNFSPQIIGLLPSWLSGFENDANNGSFFAQHFLLVVEGPAWGDTSVPGMKKLIDDQQQYAPDQKPDHYFGSGYVEAWAIDQVLEQAVKNGDLSRGGIQRALKQVGTLRFDGLASDYKYGSSTKDRSPPRASTIAKVVAGQPIGLEIVAANYTSEAAQKLKFEGR
jgi:ABC-type branched-subunit amino acid transport system substrate-binding protein